MEGTQTDIAAASALKMHKVTHNLHNVSCIKNLLNRCLINTSHSTKLQKKLTTPNTPPILLLPSPFSKLTLITLINLINLIILINLINLIRIIRIIRNIRNINYSNDSNPSRL